MPALVAGGAALLLLVLHLSVPMGYANYSDDVPLAPEDESISRSQVAKPYDDVDGYGPASPGLTLAGAIMALIAGALLVGGSFTPIPVAAARFVGWTLGLVGGLGAFMAITSSAYWVGLGFTTFLRALFSGFSADAAPPMQFWVISPVISLLLGGLAFWMFLQVMANVMAKRDDLRGQAQHQLRGAKAAVVFLVAVLVLPWSLQVADGEERRDAGFCSGDETCPASYVFFSAFGHGNHEVVNGYHGGILHIAEVTEDDSAGLFQGLAFSLKVMTALGWIGFLLSALATFGPLLSSAFKLPSAARFTPMVQTLSLAMAAWAGIMMVLAAAYMWKPSWSDNASFGTPLTDQSWWFAFFPIVAVVPFVWFLLNQWDAVRDVVGTVQVVTQKDGSTHSFD